MNNCEYVQKNYGVPACIGRRVEVCGKLGIIVADRGNHIGVTLDDDKPGEIGNYHPTWKIKYLDMGEIRRPTKSQARYQRYLRCDLEFDDFMHFCYWDAIWQKKYGEQYD